MNYTNFANSEEHVLIRNKYANTPYSINTRLQLRSILDGDAFFPINTWPLTIQEVSRHTPISDTNTFKLLLFLYGNGCSPHLAFEYIYASHPTKTKILKRYYQIKWICNNIQHNLHKWYYHDILSQKSLYLNGTSFSKRD